MNGLDLTLIAILVISSFIGLWRGLVKEILSILIWIVSLWVAWRFSSIVAKDYAAKFISDPLFGYLLAFGGLFFLVLFLLGMVNLLISSLLKVTGLSFIDRIFGMVFGFIRAILISTVVVFVGRIIPEIQQGDTWNQSKYRPIFMRISQLGMKSLPQDLQKNLNKLIKDASEKDKELPLKLESLSDFFNDDQKMNGLNKSK